MALSGERLTAAQWLETNMDRPGYLALVSQIENLASAQAGAALQKGDTDFEKGQMNGIYQVLTLMNGMLAELAQDREELKEGTND